ncbi:MAG: hypothetical protein ACI9BW_001333 [Gammaproteobacteria bacterium]
MQWQFVGVFAEVISAIAVVVTLVFLAVEVRNNRNAVQSSSLDALAAGFSAINYNIIGDGEFTRIWEIGLATPEELSSQERIRIAMYLQCYANHYTALRKYHELGVLPEEEWQAYLSAISSILSTPGGKWFIPRLTITPALLKEIQEHGPTKQEYAWLPQHEDPRDDTRESHA